MEFASVITTFVSIFAICNPIGLISFFVALTEGYKQGEYFLKKEKIDILFS